MGDNSKIRWRDDNSHLRMPSEISIGNYIGSEVDGGSYIFSRQTQKNYGLLADVLLILCDA